MIKNTTVKKKRLCCALLIVAILSSVFACWASAAGEENTSGDSGAEAQITETSVEEQAEVVAEEECPLIIKSASYDAESGIVTVTVANTAIKDSIFVATLNDVASVVTGAPLAIAQANVRAGNEYTFTTQYEKGIKDLPVIDITIEYVIHKESEGYADVYGGGTFTQEDIKNKEFKNILATEDVTPGEAVENFVQQTGFVRLFTTDWKCLIMIGISCVLLFLAIVKGFEPLLLLPIAFGMLLTNLPGAEMFHEELWAGGHANFNLFDASNAIAPGLLDYLYLGVKLGIYPCLIFFGVGAMTDFEPLIANPKSLLLGAAAQLGIFVTYVAAIFMGFNPLEAGSIGIIGGADGPTAIFVTSKLAPHLLGPIAVAAYSYMALVPVIQPPIMKLLTTKKERCIKMQALRKVSKAEKIIFPIVVTIFVALLVPSAAPLVGSLMLGNLFKESGVTERLSKTVQNELMNIVTIFLGVTVGATATADTFLSLQTIKIIVMGVIAFGLGTAGGVLLAKFMNLFLKNKINPLCGSAGVSAVPMAARVSQMVGQKEDPSNFLLMHAMGPNVVGVIGSAIAAGVMIALFG